MSKTTIYLKKVFQGIMHRGSMRPKLIAANLSCPFQNTHILKNWKKYTILLGFWCQFFSLVLWIRTSVAAALLHECRRLVVGHLDPGDVRGGLQIDPVELLVLVLQLAVHVTRHVSQVPNHGAHLDYRWWANSQVFYSKRKWEEVKIRSLFKPLHPFTPSYLTYLVMASEHAE